MTVEDSGFQRVLIKLNLDFKGWSSQAHREFPGNVESTNVSRDDVSREIGRTVTQARSTFPRTVEVVAFAPSSRAGPHAKGGGGRGGPERAGLRA